MDQRWADLDRKALASKNSQGALIDLMRLYAGFSPEERAMADQVLADWVESPDARKRFDALALVDRFAIDAALPGLRRLEADLERRKDHEAPFELAKVRRILQRLSAPQPAS